MQYVYPLIQLVLTFQGEGINGVSLGPSEVTGKIQTKVHRPLLFTAAPSLCSQGAGRKACSHSPAGFFSCFLGLSWWEFGVFSVACESKEAQSDLELPVRHVVHPGAVCTALQWPGATRTCSATHPWPRPCGLGLHAATGLALCVACSAHGQNLAASFVPSRTSCSEGGKRSVSDKRNDLPSHQTPS